MKNGKKNPPNKQSICICASNVFCLKVFYLQLQTFSCSMEFYRWTRTLFLNFCAVGLCEKKTNFTTTLQRNMLEGKVAVGLRWWERGGGTAEAGVESSTATLPSFGQSADSPAEACRTLANQFSFTETEKVPFVPPSTSNREQLALML